MNWIGTSLVGVLLTAAPAFAASAPADANFAAFVQVCADTHADYPAVVAAADAQGWKAAQVNGDTLPGVTVTDTLPPAGLTATSIGGVGWSCSQPSGP